MKDNSSAGQKPANPSSKSKTLEDLAKALQRIEELESKLRESQEKEMRLFADVQNVRRRAEEDRSSLIFESGKKILGALLPTIDNFDRAMENLPSEFQENEWVKGVLAIQKEMDALVKKEGVEEINATGVALDPNLHEAVMTDPEGEEGKVTRILAKGYRYMGRVLRPARVAVGSKL